MAQGSATRNILGIPSEAVTQSPSAGRYLFAFVFLAQLGHLIEHISVAISGHALLGTQFDSELSHLMFNSLIALLVTALVVMVPRNPWVYPLALVAVLHVIEHIYIFARFTQTGLTNEPGLLGIGGAIGLIPLARLDLHNIYNGVEIILMVLGLSNELEEQLELEDAP